MSTHVNMYTTVKCKQCKQNKRWKKCKHLSKSFCWRFNLHVWWYLFISKYVLLLQDNYPKVTMEAQLGLIGGTMGLLTGFSILSGVEIIYYLIRFRFWRVFKVKVSVECILRIGLLPRFFVSLRLRIPNRLKGGLCTKEKIWEPPA